MRDLRTEFNADGILMVSMEDISNLLDLLATDSIQIVMEADETSPTWREGLAGAQVLAGLAESFHARMMHEAAQADTSAVRIPEPGEFL